MFKLIIKTVLQHTTNIPPSMRYIVWLCSQIWMKALPSTQSTSNKVSACNNYVMPLALMHPPFTHDKGTVSAKEALVY